MLSTFVYIWVRLILFLILSGIVSIIIFRPYAKESKINAYQCASFAVIVFTFLIYLFVYLPGPN